MKLKAFGINIQPEEYEIIYKMAAIVTPQPVEAIDLMCKEPEIDPNDVLLLYGVRAARHCGNFKCRAKLELEAIEKLVPGQDEELREEAHNKLLQFKEMLDSDSPADDTNTIQTTETVEDPLPSYDCNRLESLEEAVKEFRGITEDGKSFKITLRPSTKDADICMTFAELCAVKQAKDLLRWKELQFVHRRATTSRKGSS